MLVVGGAVIGHLAQFLFDDRRLRLVRILAAVLAFDVGFALVFRQLVGRACGGSNFAQLHPHFRASRCRRDVPPADASW